MTNLVALFDPMFLQKRIIKCCPCIFTFLLFSALGKSRALYWYKLYYPFTKTTLCQVWFKLVKRFRRRRFSNFVYLFSVFRHYLPWKILWRFIKTNMNLNKRWMFCAKAARFKISLSMHIDAEYMKSIVILKGQ